ncbi:rna binding domain-containing protein [Diplodia corticola]|uniref:Rna binding domain-containing protein n=1 Tax=Diplodia corticola TaxID=236234 RepID=A0A1J9QTN7_9PEZI|nr:rna binding domain-containing protein [Diplodia corticola]OJD32342.1 rna binding domain-containing protein [Diplodia corticola]
MDRALDDVISDRQVAEAHADAEAAAALKTTRETADWVHDRYEDDDARRPSRTQGYRSERPSRRSPDYEKEAGYEIRVENLHYDLTEEDIRELFERIGPVKTAKLLFDRNDRSQGIARVVYHSLADARVALREFDGANAHGQPIRLTLVPPGPSGPSRRNPFDSVERPSRSLFERIEGGRSNRSLSPDRPRHSDTTKPAPAGIDRYVPGEDDGRRLSPPRRRGDGGRREAGRRPGERRQQPRGKKPDGEGKPAVGGRPRKTVEELDAEMADYFGGGGEDESAGGHASNGAGAAASTAPANSAPANIDDIDMVE